MLPKSSLVLLTVWPKSILAQVKSKSSKNHLTNSLPLHANRVIFRPFHANRVIFAPFTHFLPLCSPAHAGVRQLELENGENGAAAQNRPHGFQHPASRMPRAAIARVLHFSTFPSLAGVEFDQSPVAPSAGPIIILALWSEPHRCTVILHYGACPP